MKTVLTLILFVFLTSLSAQVNDRFEEGGEKNQEEQKEKQQSQDSSSSKKKDKSFFSKLMYGGGLSLNFGTNTFINVSPQVGYPLTDNLIAGGGYQYTYAKFTVGFTGSGFRQLPDPISRTIHGPNIFGNFFFLDNFVVGAQYEVLQHDAILFDPITAEVTEERRWTPVLFLQGGISSDIGRNGRAMFGMRVNLLHDNFSPYSQEFMPFATFFF